MSAVFLILDTSPLQLEALVTPTDGHIALVIYGGNLVYLEVSFAVLALEDIWKIHGASQLALEPLAIPHSAERKLLG